MQIRVKLLSDKGALPQYASTLAAGADLVAAPDAPIALAPQERQLIPTGIAIELPPGFAAEVRPRSGLALKHGITVLNTPGTIDADYRGEIKVLLINHGNETFIIEPGTRIAQLIVNQAVRADFALADELNASERGLGGFGSTGR
jgi:dUTP pyrophosphatase